MFLSVLGGCAEGCELWAGFFPWAVPGFCVLWQSFAERLVAVACGRCCPGLSGTRPACAVLVAAFPGLWSESSLPLLE